MDFNQFIVFNFYNIFLDGNFGFFCLFDFKIGIFMFQIWVSFDSKGQFLFERIKLVREQFDIKLMDLDDINQCDIDDLWVILELIFYLLNREGV